VRIAVIGDVHLKWDAQDVRALDAAGYDLVLFVGDLAGYRAPGAVRVARSIAQLKTPALVLPGNHDAVTAGQLWSEVVDTSDKLRAVLALGMPRRVEQLRRALGPVPLCGYSLHHFEAHELTVLAARPHSMGGARLAYRHYLRTRFGVDTLDDSAARLRALLDEVPPGRRIVVLAHCGPTGLGDQRDAIYGCDFRVEQGDWGDSDLADALRHARHTNKLVVGVFAGHMHHSLRGGGERSWQLQHEGVTHVNAARVPRWRRTNGRDERHHVSVTLDGLTVTAEPVWLP
jgi:uncharacterized protein (TIGR04168 family)